MGREPFTSALVAQVEAECGRVCWLCERPVPAGEKVSLDHVVPVIYGGTNALENLRPAHTFCNRQRGEWDVASYYGWAIARGDDNLVPTRLLEQLRPGAAALADQARTHYGRTTRGTTLAPLGGTWPYAPI